MPVRRQRNDHAAVRAEFTIVASPDLDRSRERLRSWLKQIEAIRLALGHGRQVKGEYRIFLIKILRASVREAREYYNG